MNALRRLTLFACCIAVFFAGRAIGAETRPKAGAAARSPNGLLKDVAQYKFGDNRMSLLAAERLTLAATDEAAQGPGRQVCCPAGRSGDSRW